MVLKMRSCCCPAVFSLPLIISPRSRKEHTHKHLCLVICCLDPLHSPEALNALCHSGSCYITGKKKQRKNSSLVMVCLSVLGHHQRVTRRPTLVGTRQRRGSGWHCGTLRYCAICGASHRGGVFFGKFASPYQVLWSEGAEKNHH